jgi:hypothetical protein
LGYILVEIEIILHREVRNMAVYVNGWVLFMEFGLGLSVRRRSWPDIFWVGLVGEIFVWMGFGEIGFYWVMG